MLTGIRGGGVHRAAPASTMGLLSEMLLEMKPNVINNPLAADVPALPKRGEERDRAAIA